MIDLSEPIGAPIPGSKFYRDYCPVCFAPIRVPKELIGSGETCGCSEKPPASGTGMTYRQLIGKVKTSS